MIAMPRATSGVQLQLHESPFAQVIQLQEQLHPLPHSCSSAVRQLDPMPMPFPTPLRGVGGVMWFKQVAAYESLETIRSPPSLVSVPSQHLETQPLRNPNSGLYLVWGPRLFRFGGHCLLGTLTRNAKGYASERKCPRAS